MNTKDSNETSGSTAPAAPPAAATAPANAAPGRARRLGLYALGAVVLLCGLGYGGYWFFDGRYFESTDDGYVNGDVVQVTSEVPGTVLALNVDDTQLVEAGQPLLTLDPGPLCARPGIARADRAA
jgi:membrane fusion protein, multidrug efflux system